MSDATRSPNREPSELVEAAVQSALDRIGKIYHPRAELTAAQKEAVGQALSAATASMLTRFPEAAAQFRLPLVGEPVYDEPEACGVKLHRMPTDG